MHFLNLLNIFGGATKACIIRFGATTQQGIGTSFGIAILMYPREFVRENVEFVTIDADTIQTPIVDIEEEIEDAMLDEKMYEKWEKERW